MTIIIRIGIFLLNILYFFLKLLPQQNKVTFISRQSDAPGLEFCMLRDRIHQQNPAVKTVLLCRTLKGGAKAALKVKMRYGLHIFVQMYHLATSKVAVLDTYCIPVSILRHKKNLRIVQMWHSMGTMKRFGYTALDTLEGSGSRLARVMRMHKNYDVVFASAEAYKEHLAQGFQCDIDKIITMPLPRLDLLRSESYSREMQQKIYARYPELKQKPVILYCPTFRINEKKFERAVNRLADLVDPNRYNLVVKLHPLSKTRLRTGIREAKEFSGMDLLFVADYVISDYSCIIYEAAVRQIPLYFYNFDFDLYQQNRGLAIDYYGELPGVISKKPEAIMQAIEQGGYDMDKLKAFSDKYVEPVDDVTGKITDLIFDLLNNRELFHEQDLSRCSAGDPCRADSMEKVEGQNGVDHRVVL